MTRAAQILFVLVAVSICIPLGATIAGMTFEHFAGQDGDE
ncbi:putative membrane protein [Bradyrhizobium japonicum]|nr:putative membrane protein [Bradyrhizobium elkanii]MCS3567801.1 putative membrane protein [Bradyrhizobium elkanii]MCS3590716.1 putative membrane protein [Bradyrhizobium elkanii]MCS3620159.1 putative membrane protein [Bradyrhizobium elkanii]